MGWFEDQVKERKELDKKVMEDSFKMLRGLEIEDPTNIDEKNKRENYAISQILTYYRHQMIDIPSNITDFTDKLNYALGQYDVEYRKVILDDSYIGDDKAPLIIFTILSNLPVVIFPIKHKQYYYFDYETGKKVKINAELVNRLEMEALIFYRPLPKTKMSLKECISYIKKSIRPSDIFLLVLTTLITTGVGLLLPYFTKQLTGDVVETGDYDLFIMVSIYVVAAATGLLLVKSAKALIDSRVGIRIIRNLQEATIMRLLSLPVSFFKKYNTGELAARFNSVSAMGNLIINEMFMTLLSVVMSIVYLFQMVALAPALLIPVIVIQSVATAFSVTVAYINRDYTKKVLELSSKEDGVTYEMINGIQKIRLSGSEKRAFAKWTKVYLRAAKLKYNPPLILKLSGGISLTITLIGSIVLYMVSSLSDMDVGSYMAFITCYGLVSAAFVSLGQVIGTVYSVQPLYEMARPILSTEPETDKNKMKVESVRGNIRLDNVSFRYNEDGPLILDHLSLEIKEGEFVAFVGQSGCGKSTLVRVILGFEEPEEGDVYFDGNNIKDVDMTSLRRNIGSVIQNGNLFHGDIYSNIIISSPDKTEADAWRAAEIAGVADDIRDMPMGMKTVISEGQGGISGGQKQRIMIARAIVHEPKILIFDEATSALDNKTQKTVTESIERLNCTRIVIAHRLSTIKDADRIIMLEGGRIIEEGDYQTLIDKNGKFAELVDRQRLDND